MDFNFCSLRCPFSLCWFRCSGIFEKLWDRSVLKQLPWMRCLGIPGFQWLLKNKIRSFNAADMIYAKWQFWASRACLQRADPFILGGCSLGQGSFFFLCCVPICIHGLALPKQKGCRKYRITFLKKKIKKILTNIFVLLPPAYDTWISFLKRIWNHSVLKLSLKKRLFFFYLFFAVSSVQFLTLLNYNKWYTLARNVSFVFPFKCVSRSIKNTNDWVALFRFANRFRIGR